MAFPIQRTPKNKLNAFAVKKMGIETFLLVVAGLTLFEIITSVDNAIINADILATMKARARRWFLL